MKKHMFSFLDERKPIPMSMIKSGDSQHYFGLLHLRYTLCEPYIYGADSRVQRGEMEGFGIGRDGFPFMVELVVAGRGVGHGL